MDNPTLDPSSVYHGGDSPGEAVHNPAGPASGRPRAFYIEAPVEDPDSDAVERIYYGVQLPDGGAVATDPGQSSTWHTDDPERLADNHGGDLVWV